MIDRRKFLGYSSGSLLTANLLGCGGSDTSNSTNVVTDDELTAAMAQLKSTLMAEWSQAYDPVNENLLTLITQLQNQFNSLESNYSADYNTIISQLESITSTLSQLSATVSDNNSNLTTLLANLQTQIIELQNNNSIQDADILDLQNNYSDLTLQLQAYAQQIIELQSTLQTAITSLGRYINVKDYGALGDGINDDTLSFRACIADAFAKISIIYIPPGTYRITDRLKCWLFTTGIGRRSVQFLGGGGVNILFIPAALNSVCFEHAEAFGFHNISITASQSDSNNHWGIAFSTPVNTTTLEPSNAQTAFSRFSNIKIRGGFKYSFYRRFTLWDSYETIDSRESLCHFMFALSSSYDAPLTDPGTGWNGGASGWFHNQVSFDNVLCEAGEVGIMGGLMGANFIQLTCQGQAGKYAQNTIIPINEAGTGVWLQGRSDSDPCRGNTFGSYYTEVTERPLKFINCTPISIGTAFWQGVTVTGVNPVAPIISLINSSVNVLGATIRGRFINFIDASNNSSAIVQLINGGTYTSGKYSVDSSSSVLDLNDLEVEKIFRLTRAANAALEDISLLSLSTTKNYTVRVYGSANGGNVDSLYSVVGATLSYVAAADHGTNTANFSLAAGARGIRLSVTNSVLNISRVQTFACDLYIAVERVSIVTVMNNTSSSLQFFG